MIELSMIATIARQQVQSLRRQRTFLGLLATFFVMTALAGLLGWASRAARSSACTTSPSSSLHRKISLPRRIRFA